MNTATSILVILTSFSEINAEPTGVWLEEFTIPYMAFRAEGYNITVASIEGGAAPIDPRSVPNEGERPEWSEATNLLQDTVPLASLKAENFDAVFLPGGHGTMFDFPDSTHMQDILRDIWEQDKVIGAVCHGPAGLINVRLNDNSPLIAGKNVTGFSNLEEDSTGLTGKMPFLLEDRLKAMGANYVSRPKWENHIVIDGRLITGQNPQSSKGVATAMISLLKGF